MTVKFSPGFSRVKDRPMTIGVLADLVQGDVEGDAGTLITGVSGIREAKPGDITFLANSKYLPELRSTQASAVVLSKDDESAGIPMIRVSNPDNAFSRIAEFVLNKPIDIVSGVHPRAYVGARVKIGKNVTISPMAVVQDDASIGDNTVIMPLAYIGHYAEVGADCLVYPNVTVRERSIIGSRVILHAGCVVGADGFGFATVKGVHHKIPQIGTVVLEDDVEIGANVCIDRARFDRTLIQKGTKIDNLVQIAHNVKIGRNCFIVSQTGIAGSAKIGNYVTLAGQSGVAGHIEIGDGCVVAGQAGVTKSLPPQSRVSGMPAISHDKWLRGQAALKTLPEAMKMIKELKERVESLEAKTENNRKID